MEIIESTRRLDIGAVLTAPNGDRFLVVDLSDSGRAKLVRIPDGLVATDYRRRFYHAPTASDPTAPALEPA